MNIKVGDKVKISAGTLCSTDCYFDHYRANGTYEGVVKELTPNHAQALVHYTHTFLSGFVVRNAWVAVEDLIKVEEPSLADESTPAGKKIWDDVRKAATRTPDYVKDMADQVPCVAEWERAIQRFWKARQFKLGQSVRVVQGDDHGRMVTIVGRDSGTLEVRRSDGTTFSADSDCFEAIPPPCEDKPIELTWRVIAIRAHDSDDTKAEITIAGTEGETVDGAVYLTVTREEAKAIHLGDVYVVSIRKKG